MATGDINTTKRPRYESQERFDATDAQAESDLRVLREQGLTKGLLGGVPQVFVPGNGDTIGTVLRGGTVTPTAPNTVGIDITPFAAVDADGFLLLKPQELVIGSLVTQISVPLGVSTVYAYSTDAPTDQAIRAFIANTSPFAESTRTIETRFSSNVVLFAVAGNATVRDIVVSGVTRPLVALALVNNSAGTVTVTQQFSTMSAVPAIQLAQPTNFTVMPFGVTGATTYSYVIVAKARNGTVLRASVVATTAAGNAALSVSNYNFLSWDLIARATQYDIYRTVGGATQGLIGTLTGYPPSGTLGFGDTGLVGNGAAVPADVIGLTLPSLNTDRVSSLNTLVTVSQALASVVADMKWQPENPLFSYLPNLQTKANNYKAFDPMDLSIDALSRRSVGVVTVGPAPTNGQGGAHFNIGDSGITNATQLMNAAFAALANTEGPGQRTVYMKAGFYDFSSASSITVPANVTIKAEQNQNLGFANNPRVTVVLGNSNWTLNSGAILDGLSFWNSAPGAPNAGIAKTGSVVMTANNIVRNSYFQTHSTTSTTNWMLNTSGLSSSMNLLVDSCTFVGTSGSAFVGTVGGLRINTVKSAMVRDCTFYTAGINAGAELGITTSLTVAGTNTGVVVDGCSFFSGSTNQLGSSPPVLINGSGTTVRSCKFIGAGFGGTTNTFFNFQSIGLLAQDAIDFACSNCTFSYMQRGVVIQFTAAITRLGSVTNCNFNNIGLQALHLSADGVSATGNGLMVSGNNFDGTADMPCAIKVDGALSSWTNVTVMGNKFLNVGQAGAGSVKDNVISFLKPTGSISAFMIFENQFDRSLNTPIWVASSSLMSFSGVQIKNNTFNACVKTGNEPLLTTATAFGTPIAATPVDFSYLEFCDNRVTDSQSGLAVSALPVVGIYVTANRTVVSIDLNRNFISACSTSAIARAYAFDFQTLSGANIQGIRCNDNHVFNSILTLFRFTNFNSFAIDFEVCRNYYKSDTGLAFSSEIVLLNLQNANSWQNCRFNDNIFSFNSFSTLGVDIINVNGGAAHIFFIANSIRQSGGGVTFSATFGFRVSPGNVGTAMKSCFNASTNATGSGTNFDASGTRINGGVGILVSGNSAS